MAHVYTRKGDHGTTSLVGGERVPKHDLRVETYGTLDELSAYIGLLRDSIGNKTLQGELLQVLNDLFIIESLIAALGTATIKQLPSLSSHRVEELEMVIDTMEKQLPPLKFFVLPGGNQSASFCHIARTICRRAERRCAKLNEIYPLDPLWLSFLNRLSDYLFLLARRLVIEDGKQELFWQPKL